MARGHTFLGIDIGTSSIKLVELAPGPGRARLVRAATVPLDGGGGAAELGDDRVREALRGALAEARTRPTTVACAVSTSAAAVREISLPHADPDEVQRMIRFEAERFIPFPPDQMTMDHHQLPGDVADSARLLVVATRKDAANRMLGLLSGLGLPHPTIDVTAVAAFNALTTTESATASDTFAVVDIGAASTDVAVANRGTLATARSSPVGGDELTRAYQEDLSIDFAEAETQKRARGVSGVPVGPSVLAERMPAQNPMYWRPEAIARGLPRGSGGLRARSDIPWSPSIATQSNV